MVRNPMNMRQVSKIKLTHDVVDGIVFWTKNPLPMLGRLNELSEYKYYFQFTITPYGKDIEPNLPHKPDEVLSAFKKLSDTIGADKVIWRYDPIFISEKYSAKYHIQAFGKIAHELRDYTRKVTISFIDTNYRNVKGNIKELALLDFQAETQTEISSSLAAIALSNKLTIDTCAEKTDLEQFGIKHARCIDDKLFEKISGCHMNVKKDPTQRLECGCVSSIDIGMYNTCKNGCKYCYANYSHASVEKNFAKHNPSSPVISGDITDSDKINERKMKSYIINIVHLPPYLLVL